jgi:hypothetical protein
MNTLREAVRTYLDMRRGLGFKLRDAGRALIDFVAFLEQHHASYITQSLALAWAQQPSTLNRPTGLNGYALHGDSRATAGPRIRARRFRPGVYCPSSRNGRGLSYTPMTTSAAYFAPLYEWSVVVNAASYGRGSTLACLDY